MLNVCQFILVIISLFASGSVGKINDVYRKNITCIEQERDALLKFKHHIKFDYCGLMSSWGNPNTPDCCTWKGVSCSNQSGHVIGLYLSGAPYQWGCLESRVITPYFCELKRLKYLDLSSNYFYDSVIPSCIGSLVDLVNLSLSFSGFSGNIPHQLGNLTRLTSLDLSYNYGISAKSLNWLSRLRSLREMNLIGTHLSKAKDWSQIIGNLPLLEILKMDYCQLSTPSTSSSFLQSANLRVISLSNNNFSSSSSFQWLFSTGNYSPLKQSLEHLDLSYTLLKGPIPDAIGNLESLTHLDLSGNSLSTSIPDAIGNLEFLTHLDLSGNFLSSIIPDAITNLHSLLHMDLSHNSLSGPIPSALGSSGALGTMHSLSYLDLSHNRLEGSIPSAIGDSRSMSHIDLSYNQLQGPIPGSLGGPSALSYLDLSNNHFEGTIPASMGNLYLVYLDLSSNKLSGNIPCNFRIRNINPAYVNFSYNNLSGSLPKYFSNFGIAPTEAFKGNPSFHTDEFQGICKEALNLSNGEQVGGDDQHDKNKIYPGLYMSIGLGFYTGFWVFCGTLTLKNSWRHAYFGFLDHIIDNIYATVAVYLARFRRNSQV